MSDISEKADELRNKLRNARNQANQPGTNTPSERGEGTNGSDNVGISETGSNIERYSTTGNTEVGRAELTEDSATRRGNQSTKSNIRSLSRQDNRDQSVGGAVAESQRRVSSSVGSTSQDDKRVRPKSGRSSEDNTENRSNGTDLPSSPRISTSRTRRVGNLVRNLNEEPNFERVPEFFQYEPKTIYTSEKDTEPESGGSEESAEPQSNVSNTVTKTRAKKSNAEESTGKRKRGRPTIKKFVGEQASTEEDNEKTSLKDRIGEYIPHYSGSRFTVVEAEKIKEPLTAALEDIFEQTDKFLFSYCGMPQDSIPVWSDVSEKEMKAFVNSFAALGQKSAIAAGMARGAVGFSDFVVGAAVLGPRIQKSGRLIRQSRQYRKNQRNADRI